MPEAKQTVRRHLGPATLTWGFGLTMALTATVSTIFLATLSYAHARVEAVVEETHRQDRIAGRTGLLVAQERILLLEALGEQDRERLEELLSKRQEIVAQTRADLARLQALEGPARLPGWTRALPALRELRRALAETADSLRRGDRRRARQLLAEVRPGTSTLQTALTEVQVADAARRTELRRELSARLRRSLSLGAALTAGLMVGLSLTWVALRRVMGSQVRQLDGYLRGLQQSNRDLDAFAARAAHDLRNVLTPLAAAPALLRVIEPDREQLAELAGRFERAVEAGQELIEDLLDFSRAGEAPGQAVAGVDEVVQEVVDLLAPRAEASGTHLDLRVPSDLHVACAPGLLRSIVSNLLGNALKFMEGTRRQVSLSARDAGSQVVLEVADTGPGVPAHHLARLGEPFYRVPGTRAAGSGLGLSTVRRILEARGGRLEVESEVGVGTRVRVHLPLAPVPDPPAAV